MSGVDHQPGPDLVGDRAEGGEVDEARISRSTTDDQLRTVFDGELTHLVVVDQLGVLADAVRHHVEPGTAEIDLAAVGEVAAVRQRHRQHRIAG